MVSASVFASADKGLLKRFVDSFLPRDAIVPVSAEDSSCEPLVKVGDMVEEGQVVARGRHSCVHSPVPGVVVDMCEGQFGDGKRGGALKIRLGGRFAFVGRKRHEREWFNLSPSEILSSLVDFGVVNTFFACEPLSLSVGRSGEGKVLAVRLFDSDPSVCADSFLAGNFAQRVVEGAAAIARAASSSAVAFLYDRSDSAARRAFEPLSDSSSDAWADLSVLIPGVPFASVAVDARKYPSGTARNLAFDIRSASKSISKRFGDSAAAFSTASESDLFVDPQTAISAYDALSSGVPVMSRFVHVTGDSVNAAAVVRAKIGTPISSLVEQCGGLKRRISRIIVNGRILGHSVGSLDVPVTKMMKSVEFVPDGAVRPRHPTPCVRCGACRRVCPMGLWPGNVYRVFNMVSSGEIELDGGNGAVLASALACVDCSLCNSVCPSRLPLSQTVAMAKIGSWEGLR